MLEIIPSAVFRKILVCLGEILTKKIARVVNEKVFLRLEVGKSRFNLKRKKETNDRGWYLTSAEIAASRIIPRDWSLIVSKMLRDETSGVYTST